MLEYIELGPCPYDEEPSNGSIDEQIKEVHRYKEMLKTCFPDYEKHDCRFIVKTFDHDFGPYREACITFNREIPGSLDYAIEISNNTPQYWNNGSILATVCRTGDLSFFDHYKY